MSKAFKIINSEHFEKPKTKYPNLPFVVMDEHKNNFLVFYDSMSDKYRYINLDCEDTYIGHTESPEYDSLEEMFEDNKKDIILETELIIKGIYKTNYKRDLQGVKSYENESRG